MKNVTLTLGLFANGALPIHSTAAWYLSELGEFRGMQEIYTRHSPQRLKALREHALIESALSSNRIEGVSVEPSRIRDVLAAPKPLFRDRDEEEVRGYRNYPLVRVRVRVVASHAVQPGLRPVSVGS